MKILIDTIITSKQLWFRSFLLLHLGLLIDAKHGISWLGSQKNEIQWQLFSNCLNRAKIEPISFSLTLLLDVYQKF